MPAMGNTNTTSDNTPKPGAPVLTELVAGLEAKIAADPENVGHKILLAQTYNEIGKRKEGIALLRELRNANPDTTRITLVLASLLTGGENQNEINEALGLLNGIDDIDKRRAGAVPLYRGIAYIKLGEQKQALRTWRQALQEIAKDDMYRPQIEQQIAQFQ
jgi:cytochrome c-type biogenesis protein CcmH/NrfG